MITSIYSWSVQTNAVQTSRTVSRLDSHRLRDTTQTALSCRVWRAVWIGHYWHCSRMRGMQGLCNDMMSVRMSICLPVCLCHLAPQPGRAAGSLLWARRAGNIDRVLHDRRHSSTAHSVTFIAGQRDICPIFVNLPSASKHISVPGLVPWHCDWSPVKYSHLQWILEWFY